MVSCLIKAESEFCKHIVILCHTPEMSMQQNHLFFSTATGTDSAIGQWCMLRAYAFDICLHHVFLGNVKSRSMEEVCFVLLTRPHMSFCLTS